MPAKVEQKSEQSGGVTRWEAGIKNLLYKRADTTAFIQSYLQVKAFSYSVAGTTNSCMVAVALGGKV